MAGRLQNSTKLMRARRFAVTAALLLSLLAVFQPIPLWAQTATDCDGSSECAAPFVRLSNESNFPYLWYGMRPSEPRGKSEDPNLEEHLRAIEMFPSVRECLLPEEAEKEVPDLSRIDWARIPDVAAVEVCIFRVASSIRSADSVKMWLQNQAFTITDEMQASEAIMRLWQQDSGPGYTFSAGRGISNGRVFWGNWYQKHIYYPAMLARSITLTITFNSAEEVVSVTTYVSHAFSK